MHGVAFGILETRFKNIKNFKEKNLNFEEKILNFEKKYIFHTDELKLGL